MKRHPRPCAGFTLLEMTIVVLVSMMVFLLGASLHAHYSRRSADLIERAETLRELRLAVEWLRQDVGGADNIRRLNSARLRISRSPETLARVGGTAPDAGIDYLLTGEHLERIDRELGGNFVVATGLTAFEVTERGQDIEILLRAGTGTEEQEIVVLWRN